MLKDTQFVFIIGSPRSGTTLLYNLISAHANVASVGNELTIFDHYIFPLVRSYDTELDSIQKKKWEIGLPLLWNREKFDEFISSFIERIYTSMGIDIQHKLILDKHPEYSFYIDLIHYYLPNAKFIHIIRDGRDVAYSLKRVWHSVGFGASDFEKGCSDWLRYKMAARKAKMFPNNYYELRYEDLMANPSSKIAAIFEFCGLASSPELIQEIILKNMGEENMVSVPDPSVSYTERTSEDPLWKKRLSKKEIYLAEKYLKNDLIAERYENSDDWGLNFLEHNWHSVKSFTGKTSAKLLATFKNIFNLQLNKNHD